LVNDEVAARIISEAERLGYRPDTAAAALRSGRSRLVGALVPGIANPVFTPILAGAVAALAREHFALIVADPGRDGGSAFDMVQELAARRVEGLLLATTLGLPDPCIELALARNIPYVLINRGLPGLASVVPDNAMGMGLVLNHLRGLGHRHIGYVSGFAHLVADTVRSECFVDLMRAAGLDADLVEEAHSFDRAGGLAATRALLARAPEMTALVCGNDLIAAGAYDAAAADDDACDVGALGQAGTGLQVNSIAIVSTGSFFNYSVALGLGPVGGVDGAVVAAPAAA
jgi:LacI family transcriptional regulator